jgi:hypothetical protein
MTCRSHLFFFAFALAAPALVLVACSNTSAPAKIAPATIPAPARSVADVREFHRMITPGEAADYAGDAECVRCHGDICRQQGKSRHALTLQPVTVENQGENFRDANAVKDPTLGYVYMPGVADGKCAIRGKGPGGQGTLSADWVMGSGRNAHTYLSRVEPDMWVDLRISYYIGPQKWDFTPMQKPGDRTFTRAAGIEQRGERLANCLLCHSTTVVASSDGPDLKASHFGIGCERCHGPSRAHVVSAEALAREGKGALDHLEDLTKATPERINEVCGGCHRTEKNAPPGDPHTENGLARFEGAALARSRCFRESKALSCVTCHDPHGDADADPKRNDSVCKSCHGGAGFMVGPARTTCRVNRIEGCVRCHMPAQEIKSIPHAAYHHHWIKVWREQAPQEGSQTRRIAD